MTRQEDLDKQKLTRGQKLLAGTSNAVIPTAVATGIGGYATGVAWAFFATWAVQPIIVGAVGVATVAIAAKTASRFYKKGIRKKEARLIQKAEKRAKKAAFSKKIIKEMNDRNRAA